MTASLSRAWCCNWLTAADTASLIAAVLQPPAADSLPAEDPCMQPPAAGPLPAEDPCMQPGPLLNASPDAKGVPAPCTLA